MITPLPGATPLVPGSCTLPLPGIMAAVVDETGQDVPNGQGGILVVKRPWPSMLRNVWGDPERYKKSYFPEELGGKLYLAGDGAVRDKDTGYFTIMGRIDDVLNVSGHRLGTMEIESALVVESARRGSGGRRPSGRDDRRSRRRVRRAEARASGRRRSGRRSRTNCAPGSARKSGRSRSRRTSASARTCRRRVRARSCAACLRSLAKGEEITQDVSTLENPAILDQLSESL